MDDDFSTYEAGRDAGVAAPQAYREAVAAGLDPFARIRMLRAVYGLSLLEAKDVTVRVETGQDLDAYQSSLLPGVERALDQVEREPEG